MHTLFAGNVGLVPDLAGIANEFDIGVSHLVWLGVGVDARSTGAVILNVRRVTAGAVDRCVGNCAL